jgi:uncharacterized membrane protein
MRKIANRILSYFLQGVIIVVPLVAVALTGKYLFDSLTSYQILGHAWLTVVVIIAVVLLVGMLAQTVLMGPLFVLFEDLMSRAPLVKFVYSAIKDLMEAFVGEKKRFTKPVLVNLIHETQLQRFGFITEEDLARIGPEFEGKVAVYIPMSYSVSGNLFIVPANLLTPLRQVEPAELMKYILSGGVTDLEDILKGKKDREGKEQNQR